jgi:hypothetical protein
MLLMLPLSVGIGLSFDFLICRPANPLAVCVNVFPTYMQACDCITSIAAWEPELWSAVLSKGVEPLLRQAMVRYLMACGYAGSAALRVLGLKYHNS